MSVQVWISRSDAIKLMKESAWGQLKSPTVTRRVKAPANFYSGIFGGKEYDERVSGLSETEKAHIRFDAFLDKTLDQFISDNPLCYKREKDGQELVDEAGIRAFLRKATEIEIRDEFGEVPSFKV